MIYIKAKHTNLLKINNNKTLQDFISDLEIYDRTLSIIKKAQLTTNIANNQTPKLQDLINRIRYELIYIDMNNSKKNTYSSAFSTFKKKATFKGEVFTSA